MTSQFHPLSNEEISSLTDKIKQESLFRDYLNKVTHFFQTGMKVVGLHPQYQNIIDELEDNEFIIVKDDVIGKITTRGDALLKLASSI